MCFVLSSHRKQELEQLLLASMQSFVMSIIRSLMEPMLSFLTQVLSISHVVIRLLTLSRQATAILNILSNRKDEAGAAMPHFPPPGMPGWCCFEVAHPNHLIFPWL